MKKGLLAHYLEPDTGKKPFNLPDTSINMHPNTEGLVDDAQVELEWDRDFVWEQKEDPTLSQA